MASTCRPPNRSAKRRREGKIGAPCLDPGFEFRKCGIVGTARILLHIPPMAIARRLHHRPIDPRWLDVSPPARSAASSMSRPRFVARNIEEADLDDVLDEDIATREVLVARERFLATL